MTYSICATTGTAHGIAIATEAPTVGSLAPFLSTNGAVSTQSLVSIPLGMKAAQLMDKGASVNDAINTLLEKDDNATVRQIHGVDQWQNMFIFSGDECVDWYGGVKDNNYTVAGNMLVGEQVTEAIANTFESTDVSQPLTERLLEALQAGEDAGGDKRAPNAQSAALKVYNPDTPRLQDDLRVDDHENAVPELHRIYEVTKAVNEEWQNKFSEAILQRHP
jgi:uncharacterized Ntn-hydrolase superfamily protein